MDAHPVFAPLGDEAIAVVTTGVHVRQLDLAVPVSADEPGGAFAERLALLVPLLADARRRGGRALVGRGLPKVNACCRSIGRQPLALSSAQAHAANARSSELRGAFGIAFANIAKIIAVLEHHQSAGRLRSESPVVTLTALIGPLLVQEMFRRTGIGFAVPQIDTRAHVAAFLEGRVER